MNYFNRQSQRGIGNFTPVMSGQPVFYIVCTTYVVCTVRTFQNVNCPHKTKINKKKPVVLITGLYFFTYSEALLRESFRTDFVRRSSLRRAKAEKEGFEPPEPFGSTVFKTAAIDHSAISPLQKQNYIRNNETTYKNWCYILLKIVATNFTNLY